MLLSTILNTKLHEKARIMACHTLQFYKNHLFVAHHATVW